MNPQLPLSMLGHTKQQARSGLDTVVKDGEQDYIRLFDELLKLGDPYIDNFDQAVREQVFKCIRDKTASVSGTKQAGS